jgi:hypothetical protein
VAGTTSKPRPVAQGQMLTWGEVAIDDGSSAVRLRHERE